MDQFPSNSPPLFQVQHFLKVCVEQQPTTQPSDAKDEESSQIGGENGRSSASNNESSSAAGLQPPSESSKPSAFVGMNQATAVMSMALVALGESYGEPRGEKVDVLIIQKDSHLMFL